MAAITIGGTSSTWIRACVLLLLGEQPAHGYELLRDLERLGAHGVDSGSLYRVLRRTERDGLTRSRWEAAESGPPRRVYGLTATGSRVLAEVATELEQSRQLVNLFLDRSRDLSATVP